MSQLGSFHSSEQQFRGTKLGQTLPTLLHSWVFWRPLREMPLLTYSTDTNSLPAEPLRASLALQTEIHLSAKPL